MPLVNYFRNFFERGGKKVHSTPINNIWGEGGRKEEKLGSSKGQVPPYSKGKGAN